MSKQQYAEFYEYYDMFYKPDLSKETKSEMGEILMALEKVMKICLIDKDEKR